MLKPTKEALEEKIRELERKIERTKEIGLRYNRHPCDQCDYHRTFHDICYSCDDFNMHTNPDAITNYGA